MSILDPNEDSYAHILRLHREWQESQDRALESGVKPLAYYHKDGKIVYPGGETAYVYRMWEGDTPAYVGKTVSPPTRISGHARDKDWFERITRIEILEFKTEDDALREEAFDIRNLTPTYNTSMPIVEGRRTNPVDTREFEAPDIARKVREGY